MNPSSSSSARVVDARRSSTAASGGTAAAVPFKHRKTILSAVEVEVPREDPPAGYGLAMAMLAAFLVLIGALYVAVVTFLGWLFVWHVYQGVESLGRGPYFLFHFPMALLGGLLVLFLIKPVFFRPKPGADGVVVLTAEEEPLLFDFVGRLCDATGARRPAVIEVDCDPNAGARLLKTGVTGALSGNELVLRFGLPLAASMTVRQFAGVLAHELGHFKQRGGMRGSLLIRLMVAFFAKVVFQRDRLDLKLHRMRRSGSAAGRVVFWAAAWLIEAARGVLWVLVVLGELMTCGVLRRMEYDADRVEAHVAGCREFMTTSRLMLFLSIAARRARADVADAWEQRRLADDMPRLIVAHAKQLAEHKDDILKLLDGQTTGVFDTHPCHNDRVAAVNETGAEGLVACDVGARHLFRDFGATCRRATESLYRAIVGDALDGGKLVPVSELVEQRRGERDSFAALRRFFRNGAAPSRPILPGNDAGLRARPGEDAELKRELARARQEMLALAPLAAESSEQYEVSNATLVVAHAKVKFATMLASAASVQMSNGAQRDIQAHEPMRLRAVHNLIGFEKAARRRLTAALRLAQSPPWCDPAQVKLPPAASGGSADARTVAHLTRVCQLLQPHVEKVEKLRELSLNLGVLMGAYDGARPYPPLVRRILQADADVIETLKVIKPALADVPYPFAHATAGISVGAALLTRFPDPQDPVDCHGAARSVIERFYDLLYRALAELTTHAERIERGIGLEALPDLPAPDRDQEKQKREAARAEELAEGRRDARRYWTGYGLRAAGGVCLMSVLVWLSVSPPELPAMGWPSGAGGGGSSVASDGGYRPVGFGMSRRTYSRPSYAYPPVPDARQAPAEAVRRRLMMPQVDRSVPSVTTTPEELEQMQLQRRRPSYAGESPNEPRMRYVGPQPGAPRTPAGAPAAPGGNR